MRALPRSRPARPAAALGAAGRIALLGLLLLTAGCGLSAAPTPTAVLPPLTSVAPAPTPTAVLAVPSPTTSGVPPTEAPPTAPAATAPVSPTLAPPPVDAGFPRFAVDVIEPAAPLVVSATQAAGVQLIRMRLSWAEIEPKLADPPAYVWADYDALLSRFGAGGVQVLLTVAGCPPWACTDTDGPLDKTGREPFARFVAAAADRYSQAPYNVHYWEMFNEPDATDPPDRQGAWGLHGAEYAALLRATTPLVRRVDPQARVLLGGLAYEWFMDEQPNPGPFNRSFLHDVAAAGGTPYFDYLNFHYYPQNPHWPSIADKVAALRQTALAAGIDKPIVCTEVGLTSSTDPRWTAPGWPPNSEQVQARFLVRAYTEGLAGGLSSIVWFTLHDWQSTNPGLQIFLQTGLVRADGEHKPALTAYRTLAWTVGRRPFAHPLSAALPVPPDLRGAVFGTPGDEVWVVWSAGDQPGVLTLPQPGPRRILSLDGQPLPAEGPTVTVGPDPIYLLFQKPAPPPARWPGARRVAIERSRLWFPGAWARPPSR